MAIHLETERLILRPLKKTDFAAVHSYSSNPENIPYMLWGPNTEAKTREYIKWAIKCLEADPVTRYEFAAELKQTGRMIGACPISSGDGEGEIGWILHRDFWRMGYGFEMGRALLRFGFEHLNLHRITARCDAENTASFKLMEKMSMRREGLFVQARAANRLVRASGGQYSDEYRYAILREEWAARAALV